MLSSGYQLDSQISTHNQLLGRTDASELSTKKEKNNPKLLKSVLFSIYVKIIAESMSCQNEIIKIMFVKKLNLQ